MFCHVKHGKNMGQVAVYTAVRKQAEDVKRLSVFLCIVNRFQINGVFKELSFRNFLGDFREDLEDNTSSTDIRMADFGITHLSRRKTDVHTGGLKLGVGIFCKECIQTGLLCLVNGIARGRRGNAKTVHDDQNRAVLNRSIHILITPAPSRRRWQQSQPASEKRRRSDRRRCQAEQAARLRSSRSCCRRKEC